MSRMDKMAQFVAGHGLDPDAIRPLAADASFRQYFRIDSTPPRVLMDAPPDKEDVVPFIAVGQHLRSLGMAAPALLAHDLENGFLLLEDLGDNTFTTLLSQGEAALTLYQAAVDELLRLHQHAPPRQIATEAGPTFDLPPYDDNALMTEARLFTDWYMPAAGITPTQGVLEDYEAIWNDLFPLCRIGDDVLVHRDYHVDNLMMTHNGCVGLLDYQDALAGPPAYDLVSLLQDCRYHVPAEVEEAMLNAYIAARPDLDEEAFRTAYRVMGTQRHIKIVGIFVRLWQRDGKPGYLQMIPYLWDLLDRSLQHPALNALAAWLARYIPEDMRRQPLPGAPA